MREALPHLAGLDRLAQLELAAGAAEAQGALVLFAFIAHVHISTLAPGAEAGKPPRFREK